MNVTATHLPGVAVVETAPHLDPRGAFFRAFCEEELAPVLGQRRIAQINVSHTSGAGTVRGMHFQHAPHAEMKLIRCLSGTVWDVVVDLRPDSSTYLKWHAVQLSEENRRMLVVPEGCAHGFQTLDDECSLLYLHTAAYAPHAEGGVRYDDPALGITWPLQPAGISPRDSSHPFITSSFSGVRL